MMENITFMGGNEGQHKKVLKRLQYTLRWRKFYEQYNKNDTTLKWFGLYLYDNTMVVAGFSLETYLKKHKNKSMTTKKVR